MRRPGHWFTTTAIASLVMLGGCAIAPEQLTTTEITTHSADALARVTADQQPIDGSIDLYEAMARALKYNLDHKVEVMEASLRVKELDLAHYGMLPNLVGNLAGNHRDNDNASFSRNIFAPPPATPSYSTSQERENMTGDISFSWNILDFGLSYVRARQAADKYLIQQELRRKVAARVIEDVRTAYWRAVSADRLLKKLRGLEGRVEKALANSRDIAASGQTSPITAVTYERELVEIKRTIQELQRDLSVARTQLSSLMNLKPGTAFSLGQTPGSKGKLKLHGSAEEMIHVAMENRSELREVWYQKRINESDRDAALLELLPGLQLFAGSNYDSNDFLYNNNWVTWGSKVSWNLLRLAQLPAKHAVVDAQQQLLDQRSLAVTMAVMTQVHVSRVRFQHFARELKTATDYLEVQRRLVGLMRKEADASRISEQTLIREEMNTLVAEVKRDIAYASLQNAFANVYASIGLDPYRDLADLDGDVDNLARSLRELWFERGDYGGWGKGTAVARL